MNEVRLAKEYPRPEFEDVEDAIKRKQKEEAFKAKIRAAQKQKEQDRRLDQDRSMDI